MMIDRTTLLSPKDTIIVRFFSEAETFDRSNVHTSAKPINEIVDDEPGCFGKFFNVIFCEEYVSLFVSAAV